MQVLAQPVTHTIFQSTFLYDQEEIEELKWQARQHLIYMDKIEDKEYRDNDAVVPGCECCQKTYGQLIQDYCDEEEDINYEAEQCNLNKELQGTLYAINVWDQRYQRLNANNLNNIMSFIPDHFGTTNYVHVYYQDGEIYSSIRDGWTTDEVMFREFFKTYIPKDSEEYARGRYIDVDENEFELILRDAKSKDEWLEIVNKYTKPVGHYAADIYGW